SLWALQRLAQRTHDAPTDFNTFLADVSEDAWDLALELSRLESADRRRLTTALPANPNKRHSSEEGFRSFAIGTIYKPRDKRSVRVLAGPFYTWRVTGLEAA